MKKKIIAAVFLLGILTSSFLSVAWASTNIVASPTSSRWAWNDVVAWIDFYITDTVTVLSPKLQGYASSSVSWISLDCGTSPAGNICGSSDYKVYNDGAGNLSGWAWNDSIGWISLCGGQSTTNCPGSISYRVLIDAPTGDFSGWAWNDSVGWISFNCIGPPNHCSTSQYKLETSWVAASATSSLDSSTFDTSIAGGAQINSVVWQGSMPSPTAGAAVSFQFAVSNSSSGPWGDEDFHGPDGTENTYYTTYAPNTPYIVSYTLHNNMRYFRYRVTLTSNQTQTSSPRVDNISVNWSR